MHKKGLTLLEIIISVVILSLVITGLVNVFVSSKRLLQHARYRMAGGEIGKKFIDPLQAFVRQDTWDTNPLGSNGTITGSVSAPYTVSYDTVTTPTAGGFSGTDLRKVKATITWTE